jgi:hypothetical protein
MPDGLKKEVSGGRGVRMGTLFDQPARQSFRVNENEIEEFILETEKYPGVSLSDYIKLVDVLEYRRRTNHMIIDRDVWDEQMIGFGELLKQLLDALSIELYQDTR